MAWGKINLTGGASGGLPQFTYTGTYKLLDDGDRNWRIKFLTSGTFTPAKDITVDLCIVGGGGSTYYVIPGNYKYVGGGGGGYTQTVTSIVLQKNTAYSVIVGAGMPGGAGLRPSGQGGTSSMAGYSAAGGYCSPNHSQSYGSGCLGGNGGSGGGDGNGAGGTNGADGGGTYKGLGQGTPTREFGEPSGDLYASGGHGSYGSASTIPENGAANTGNGGSSGGSTETSYAGGSGIVVIRNHRAA